MKKINLFCPVEKPPSKVAQKYSIFFSTRVAQSAQTEEFMFQNVAYRPTVIQTRPNALLLRP